MHSGRKNPVLFSKNSEYLRHLILLFQEQNHRVMVLWAFDFTAETIEKLQEKYHDEKRSQKALEMTV